MKTNTWKKVGLMGAVLVLLAIVSADYVLTSRRDAGPATTSSIGLPSPQRSMANVNRTYTYNSLNSPVPDYSETPATHRRALHGRRHGNSGAWNDNSDANTDYSQSADYNAVAINSTKPESFTHQTSRDLYGYTTNRNPYIIVERNHRVHFGVEGGFSSSNFMNQNGNMPIGNFRGGGIADISFGGHFSLQPELLYDTKGTKYQNTLDVDNKEQLRLHYIEMPVNLVFKIGKPDQTQFIFGGGPYLAYLAGAKDNFSSSNELNGVPVDIIGYVPETPNYNVSKLRKWDYGVGGFAGIQAQSLFIKAGAEFGLTDIQQQSNNSYTDRNYSLMVTAGYFFGY